MAQGQAWPNNDSKALWHLNFKINTIFRGFNLKFNVAEAVEAAAKAVAVDLAPRILALMPDDAEIFYATISRDDTKKDSRFIKDALGAGTYRAAGALATPTKMDQARTAYLFRLENSEGGSVTRKFAPIPDGISTGGEITAPPVAVVGTPIALPAAPDPGEGWDVTFNALMQALLFQCHHVETNHLPGGVYNYFPYVNSYGLRMGQKKGGRVFSG